MPTIHSTRTLVEVEGCNGSWFTISGPGMGAEGVFLGTDIDGIYDAPVKTIYTEHAHQIGASFGAFRNLRRDIVFGVTIGDTADNNWGHNDSEWRKAWSYTEDTKIWVQTEDSRRYLKVRLAEQPLFQPERDPHLMQVERVVMTVVAGDPWWYEEDAADEWTLESGTSGAGAVYIENPTDQEVWLKWVLQGPARWVLPDFSFGDNRFARAEIDRTRMISMPRQFTESTWVVDTDPFEDQLSDRAGSQIWSLMNGVTFSYPVPPYTRRTELPVSVSQAAAGVGIQVRTPRTWSRPWGLH